MLKWCKDLRIGEGVKRADKIRRKLNHGKIVPGVYLITFSENPRNLLEILPDLTMMLTLPFFFAVIFPFDETDATDGLEEV